MALAIGPAASASSGTLVITSNTTLTEDHYGSIVIAADNVTLDGAGRPVSTDPAFSLHGVLVSGHSGVTIKNVRASGFNQGAGFYVGFTPVRPQASRSSTTSPRGMVSVSLSTA